MSICSKYSIYGCYRIIWFVMISASIVVLSYIYMCVLCDLLSVVVSCQFFCYYSSFLSVICNKAICFFLLC